MNFKTPFKVLTTAALIGTLSLSTIAPGMASATDAEVTNTTEQTAPKSLEGVVIEKDGKQYVISVSDFVKLKAGKDPLVVAAKVVSVVAGGKYYDTSEFVKAKIGTDTAGAIEKLTPQELTPSEIILNENGEGEIKEPAKVDTIKLTEAIKTATEASEKLTDEAKKSELVKAIADAQAVAEKADATQADVDAAVEALNKAVEAVAPVVVETVTAINQTVDKAGTLTFQINNNGKEITAADLPEGYKANFKASAGVFDENKTESTDGKVSAKAGDKFQFEVEIKDKDGKVVAKSERVTATVQDFAQTVVSIDQVTTTLAPEDKVAQEIKDGKLGLNETVQLKVEGKVKGNKDLQDFTNGKEPVAKFSVDKPAVLAVNVDEDGKVTIEAKAKGTATVTITVGDQTEKVTYTVGDARKADKVVLSKNSVSLATGQVEKLTATVTDQYGLGYTGDMTVTNAPEVNVIAAGGTMTADAKEAGKYNITLTAADAAAKGDVAIKSGTTTIATIAVEVKAAKDEIKDYKLVATTDTKFDLKEKTEDNTQLTKEVTLKGYDEQGLEAKTQPSLTGDNPTYKLVSKDKKVATVEGTTVTLAKDAKAGDKVVIEAVKVTGALEDTVATLEFTVVDSSPTIDDITITSSTSVQTGLAVDFTKLATVTASSPEGEVKVAYTLADGNKTLNIVEAGKDGKALENAKALGTVEFDPKVTSTLTVDEDGKVTFGNEVQGQKIIASYLVDNTFKGQVELKFETKSFTGAVADKFITYGLGAGFNAENPVKVDTATAGSQTPSNLATVAKFLKTQYGATLNETNLKVEAGKATITGPLLSAEDFKKIKGDNPGEYRITMVTAESTQTKKEKVVKIAIKADGTAYFEAIKAK